MEFMWFASVFVEILEILLELNEVGMVVKPAVPKSLETGLFWVRSFFGD